MITSALLLSALAIPASESLPIDEWTERAEELGGLRLRYSTLNAEGERDEIDVVFDGIGRAAIRITVDEGSKIVRMWCMDGVCTQLAEGEEGARTFDVDIDACLADPLDWLVEATETCDLEEIEIPDARVQLSLWPAEVEDSTWNFNFSYGPSSWCPFGWIDGLERADPDVRREGDVYIATIDSGAEFRLDAETGILLGITIDPEDESAGSIELIERVDDPGDLEERLTIELPEDAEEVDADETIAARSTEMWKFARTLWIKALLDEEAVDPEEPSEAFVAQASAYYERCFAAPLASLIEQLGERVQGRAQELVDAYRDRTDDPEARAEFEKAAKEMAEGLKAFCQQQGEQVAAQVVKPPFPSDDELLEGLLEAEHAIARHAIGKTLWEPSIRGLAETLEQLEW